MLERIAAGAADLDTRVAVWANVSARHDAARRAVVKVLAERLAAVEVGLMLLVLVGSGRRGTVARMLAAVGLIYGLSDLLGRVAPRERPFVSLAAVEPLVAHSTGRSFPSRHVASGVAMGSIASGAQPGLGVVMTVVAGLLGAAR
ncbi:MAG TPA: hypothetical protein VGQ62_22925, partial [Chloroflexota bacterium]|nr:hypothetical protein [Chloroflexota bacterium]